MDTPKTTHLLKNEKFRNVYEPSEDTFLVLDALEHDILCIKKIRPCLCLEIGSGSGSIITAISKYFGSSVFCICTDINNDACDATKQTASLNQTAVECLNADLVSCFSSKIEKMVDLLIFNPPYVVTPSEEVGGRDISAAWAGGIKGREVIDRFMLTIPQVLHDDGLCYMVIIKENEIDEIEKIARNLDLKMETVISRRTGPEFLSVIKFYKIKR